MYTSTGRKSLENLSFGKGGVMNMDNLTTYGLGAANFLTCFTAVTTSDDLWTGL